MCPAVPMTTDFITRLEAAQGFSPALRSPERLRNNKRALPFTALAPAFAAAGTLRPPPLAFRLGRAAPRPALPFADALENLDQPEIDLADFHVDPDHLHLHLVPEPVDLLR